jgi:hypothetical protein
MVYGALEKPNIETLEMKMVNAFGEVSKVGLFGEVGFKISE